MGRGKVMTKAIEGKIWLKRKQTKNGKKSYRRRKKDPKKGEKGGYESETPWDRLSRPLSMEAPTSIMAPTRTRS